MQYQPGAQTLAFPGYPHPLHAVQPFPVPVYRPAIPGSQLATMKSPPVAQHQHPNSNTQYGAAGHVSNITGYHLPGAMQFYAATSPVSGAAEVMTLQQTHGGQAAVSSSHTLMRPCTPPSHARTVFSPPVIAAAERAASTPPAALNQPTAVSHAAAAASQFVPGGQPVASYAAYPGAPLAAGLAHGAAPPGGVLVASHAAQQPQYAQAFYSGPPVCGAASGRCATPPAPLSHVPQPGSKSQPPSDADSASDMAAPGPGSKPAGVMSTVQPGGVMPAVQPGGVMPAVQPGGVMPAVQPGGVMPAVQPGGVMPAVQPCGMMPAVQPGLLNQMTSRQVAPFACRPAYPVGPGTLCH